jgi:5'-nucleotidase
MKAIFKFGTLFGLASVVAAVGCSAASDDVARVRVDDATIRPAHDEGGEINEPQGPLPERAFLDAPPFQDGTWPGSEAIQLLHVSDWHGQLDPVSGVGGAAVLSSYFRAERAANPRTLTFTAGDATGASPPLSSFFDDVPAIKAMNLMGFTADTFGNHNFDRGIPMLQQHVNLATFRYVSSNLGRLSENLSGVAHPFTTFTVGHTKVAVVGITNEDAPSLTFPGKMGTLQVESAVLRANQALRQARASGAMVSVVLAHLGVVGVDAGGHPIGPLVDFARGLEGADVVLGDHTDFKVATRINGALVVENRSKGATYARIKLRVYGTQIFSSGVEFVTPVASAVTPDPAIVSMLQPYREELAQKLDATIGIASDVFVRGSNIERLREVPIGNIVADSIRARYETQLALTNSGGIRASLPSSYQPADRTLRRPMAGYAAGPPYDLVIGDADSVLPFGNVVVTRAITGAQLWAALDHSVSSLPSANGRFLQISGFRFTYTLSQPPGSRVTTVSLADGTPIPRDETTYTAALPDFVNAGGDGYTWFADGNGTTRELMADVLTDYIRTAGTVTPLVEGRIVQTP